MKRRKLFAVTVLLTVLLAVGFSVVQARAHRGILGSVAFPAPAEWGVALDLEVDFDLREVNAHNHRATGEVNWRIWHDEWGLRELEAHPSCVLFGEDVGQDPDTAIIVTRITHVSGWGDGRPGEYAYWWLRDDGEFDQMAILDYSVDPWYEFFPRGRPPACEYFVPWLIIEMGDGLEIAH